MNETSTENTTVETQSNIFCKIGMALTGSLDPKEVFQRIMTLIGEYFAPTNWSLLLIDTKTKRLKFEIVMGVDADKLKNIYLEPGEGIVGQVCSNSKPIVVDDVRSDKRFSSRVDQLLGFTTRSVVCVPLLNAQNCVIGAIELINKLIPASAPSGTSTSDGKTESVTETFTITDMDILYTIGVFAGVAAENAFLHQKVKELAIVDPLTGVNNRHYFYEEFRLEIERVKRYGNSICLLMLDVDNLKIINDRHGHLTGDKVLCVISDILKTSIRESDILARFGGDEFIILMPMANKVEATELSNRIHKSIEQWNEQSSIPGVKLGLSIGIKDAGPENVQNIIKMADEELYKSKNLRKEHEELTIEDKKE